jgi:hypothetical protein
LTIANLESKIANRVAGEQRCEEGW